MKLSESGNSVFTGAWTKERLTQELKNTYLNIKLLALNYQFTEAGLEMLAPEIVSAKMDDLLLEARRLHSNAKGIISDAERSNIFTAVCQEAKKLIADDERLSEKVIIMSPHIVR